MNWAELIKDFGIPLFAVFFGARLAFRYESKREEKKERDEQYRVIKFAHFAILNQLNYLTPLKKSRLSGYQNSENAWKELNLPPAGFSHPSFNVSELAFVLEGSNPDLLNNLTLGQQMFDGFHSRIT